MTSNSSHFLSNFLIVSILLLIVEGIKDKKPKDLVEKIPDDFVESSDHAKTKKLTAQEKNYWVLLLGALAPRSANDCTIDLSKRTARVQKRSDQLERKNLVGEWFNVEEIPKKYNGKYPLKEGDMIEISHKMGKINITVKHWAIYIGDGKMIALRQIKDKDDGGKIIAKICENVISDSRYKDNWMRKNNVLDSYFTRLDKDVILERARAKVGCKYDYKVLYWNCEHFVNLIVYDKIFSVQATRYSNNTLSANLIQVIENLGFL